MHMSFLFPLPVANMNGRQYSPFDMLFEKYVPHIPEKIFFSLDYVSFKTCLKVSSAWKELLASESYQTKGRSVFQKEILDDEEKLCEAAKNGDVDNVQRLISSNLINVNCLSRMTVPYLSTPLWEAAKRGHKEVVLLLLNKGANPNTPANGYTPLGIATIWGYTEVVQLLLNRGAEPNRASNFGETPLLSAMKNYHRHKEFHQQDYKELVQLLLEGGADPNASNDTGRTPLHAAIWSGHKEVVELLLDRGSDPNKSDDAGETPLHSAAEMGNKEMVQLLLDGGAQLNAANNIGRTPLHVTKEVHARNGKEMFKFLLDKGANPNLKDNSGDTPLSLAWRAWKYAIV